MPAASAALALVLATALLGPSAVAHGAQRDPRHGPGAGPPAALVGQPLHEAALFGIKGAAHAAAQEFRAPGALLNRVSLYLSSGAGTGTVTVQVRTERTANSSAVATRSVDLARLGGRGAGWVEFPLAAKLRAGGTYYLFAQARTDEGATISWHGTRTPAPGLPGSWHYDSARPGGWRAEEARAAFLVEPTGSARCGEAEPCYTPVSAQAARTAGLLSNGTAVEAVTPAFAVGASYVRGSNVLRLPSGNWRYLPAGKTASVVVPAEDPGALAQIAASRAWLAAGTVPGDTPRRRAAGERALLAMRALLRPNGAFAAAQSPPWQYSWPRDGSFAAAAFAATGHDREAHLILSYNATTQRADGTWHARTLLDGSGPPDRRAWQLDGNGWVPWATWQWYRAAPPAGRAERLAALYPMVRKAADHAARSLRADGLPPAAPDYWELGTDTPNIGTAAPLLAGLNASADLARSTGRTADAERWERAARKLSAGIAARFAPVGYARTADGKHGRDSAAAFMAPPFNTAPAGLAAALDDTYRALRLPNGGLLPGNDPGHVWGSHAWAPSTAFFALAWAGSGRPGKAGPVLDWVLSKRNGLGELPEKVNAAGYGSSVAPLGWTAALVLLSARALDGSPLPTPPSPPVVAPRTEPPVSAPSTFQVSGPVAESGSASEAEAESVPASADGSANASANASRG
ncbi:hypothetical protein [Streptomyces sp. NPDC097619]|uniref:hypothetical protein n=1 Tax=Streptomyces sp. NPDC097619 TaxID=3157228 RepID=UPI00331A74ED